MQISTYPSDLTAAQGTVLEPLLPPAKELGRPVSKARTMFNGILYVLRGGIPWRFLPKEYEPWQMV